MQPSHQSGDTRCAKLVTRREAIRIGLLAAFGFARSFEVSSAVEEHTVGAILRRYLKDRCPSWNGRQPQLQCFEAEKHNVNKLLSYWDGILVSEISEQTVYHYSRWRMDQTRRPRGIRFIELELHTLRNALRFASSSVRQTKLPASALFSLRLL